MSPKGKSIPILIADDDEDDRLLAQDALQESRVANDLRFVEDGVELLQYVRREGEYAEAPRPGLILLDLNSRRLAKIEPQRLRATPASRKAE